MMTNTIDLTETFSVKEREVYDLLCQNLSNEEIAENLCLTVDGVKFHLRKIYRKLGLYTTDKSEVITTRQKAIAYSGTVFVEKVAREKEDSYTREEIYSTIKALKWYDAQRVEEILDDIFAVLESKNKAITG